MLGLRGDITKVASRARRRPVPGHCPGGGHRRLLRAQAAGRQMGRRHGARRHLGGGAGRKSCPARLVRVMAPDITNLTGPRERIELYRDRLASDLANGWSEVAPREFAFDGKTFRSRAGSHRRWLWDKDTNQWSCSFHIGANPALPVPLRASVAKFAAA